MMYKGWTITPSAGPSLPPITPEKFAPTWMCGKDGWTLSVWATEPVGGLVIQVTPWRAEPRSKLEWHLAISHVASGFAVVTRRDGGTMPIDCTGKAMKAVVALRDALLTVGAWEDSSSNAAGLAYVDPPFEGTEPYPEVAPFDSPPARRARGQIPAEDPSGSSACVAPRGRVQVPTIRARRIVAPSLSYVTAASISMPADDMRPSPPIGRGICCALRTVAISSAVAGARQRD